MGARIHAQSSRSRAVRNGIVGLGCLQEGPCRPPRTRQRIVRDRILGHRPNEPLVFQPRLPVGLVELIGLMGLYVMVCMTLNAFEVPLMEGMEKPFAGDG